MFAVWLVITTLVLLKVPSLNIVRTMKSVIIVGCISMVLYYAFDLISLVFSKDTESVFRIAALTLAGFCVYRFVMICKNLAVKKFRR